MTMRIAFGILFLLIFLQFCGKETPTEQKIALFNLHIEGLVTLDGLPKSEARIVLRDYGSGSVYSELKEVSTREDGHYSMAYELRGDTSRYRLVLYVSPPPGSGTNSFDVRITEEIQTIDFEFFSN